MGFLQEWTQSHLEVFKGSGLDEYFHSDIARSEIRNVQVNNPARILSSSGDRIDERIVLSDKIDSCLRGLLNIFHQSHS